MRGNLFAVAVDLVVLTVRDAELCALLVRRDTKPFAGWWGRATDLVCTLHVVPGDGTDGTGGTDGRGNDTEVISGIGARAATQPDPGTQPTQSIDRSELDRLAAGDAGPGSGARSSARDLPGARSGEERADVVTFGLPS